MAEAYEQLNRFLSRWADFPAVELAKAERAFRPATQPRGALLTRAGDRPERVAFIVRGLVRLYVTGPEGRERTYGFRSENQLVCAYSAALRGEPAAMSIEALEPCELLVAAEGAFRELCAGHSCWRELTAGLTESLYVQQERRQRELLLDDAATRYRAFLADAPALANRLTQRQIASYVGVTPEALSRLRARLIRINDRSLRPS